MAIKKYLRKNKKLDLVEVAELGWEVEIQHNQLNIKYYLSLETLERN